MKLAKWLTFFFVTILIVTVAMSNRTPVDVGFFLTDTAVQLPLYVLFFASFFLGVCLLFVLSIGGKVRAMHELHRCKAQIKTLEQQIETLRSETPANAALLEEKK